MNNLDPKTEEIVKNLSPRMVEYYMDDRFVVTIAKAYPFIRDLLEEGQRTRVNVNNMDTIAPVILAINFDLKLIDLFANRGFKRIDELQQQAKP